MSTALAIDSNDRTSRPSFQEEIAVKLADEGVPLHCIARVTKTSSSDLRERLLEAQADGRLLSLPPTDWPIGYPQSQRALQLSRLVVENKDAISLAIGRLFGLTATEVKLLLVLLQNVSLDKNRSDMAGNTVDVHMFKIRKQLARFKIKVETVWGYGYNIDVKYRREIMDMILHHVENESSL